MSQDDQREHHWEKTGVERTVMGRASGMGKGVKKYTLDVSPVQTPPFEDGKEDNRGKPNTKSRMWCEANGGRGLTAILGRGVLTGPSGKKKDESN